MTESHLAFFTTLKNDVQHFDEAELEWLIGGLPTIDAGDW